MRAKFVCPSRYVLAEEIGIGGMGIVRAAVDRRLGREVAIKTLRANERARPRLERRFLREACVQALLDHPGIVPVYDIGRDESGALYFSMKRIVGFTLDAIIEDVRTGAVADAELPLLRAFADVCRAVHFAHLRGVVHRDLKPANVILTEDDEAYVLDWGVAAVIDLPDLPNFPPLVWSALPADAELNGHTPDGETVGTPGYLSPEQARGDAVDARSDIYALGAVLFELLSLEPLHASRTTASVMVSTLQGVDGRPSLRAPERDIAPALDAICAKATALHAADRYQTLAELLRDLERHLEDAERPALRAAS